MNRERNVLQRFFTTIREDNRIGTAHISLYMALFELWGQNGFEGPVTITRKSVMETAKICGLATYHRCIKDLHNYGYIQYEPSYHPSGKSRVNFL